MVLLLPPRRDRVGRQAGDRRDLDLGQLDVVWERGQAERPVPAGADPVAFAKARNGLAGFECEKHDASPFWI
jgi:hypothetical protein